MSQWNRITGIPDYPMDDSEDCVLVYSPTLGIVTARWSAACQDLPSRGWYASPSLGGDLLWPTEESPFDDDEPTHWRPLPTPPEPDHG